MLYYYRSRRRTLIIENDHNTEIGFCIGTISESPYSLSTSRGYIYNNIRPGVCYIGTY